MSYAEIASELRKANSVLIVSHMRPDGDAIGSQLALALTLQRLGKEVVCWNHDPVPAKLSFLPGADMIISPPQQPVDFDLVVSVDTSDRERLGDCDAALGNIGCFINIDHHATNQNYGDINFIAADCPATGQIIYELIRAEELPFNYEIADNLFAAISTDTGSFQYPSTTARTFEIAAELIQAGVDVGRLSELIYESYPLRRVELLRSLLNSLELLADNRLAIISLPLEEARRIGSRPEDTEGLIDHVRSIDSVQVAAFIEEVDQQQTRASLRSKNDRIDVAAICAKFGGGGHRLAAGARINKPFTEARKMLAEAVTRAVTDGNQE